MRKFLKFLLKVITFNGRFFVKKHVVKNLKEVNQELQVSETTNLDIKALLKALGTKNNVMSISATINTLVVEFKDWKEINQEELKQFGVKGLMRSGQKMKMIFGDDAQAIQKAMTKLLV